MLTVEIEILEVSPMGIELKIMLSGALVLGGFLWSYLFLRQFLYNFMVAFPLIKKMNTLQPNMIAVGATRYTVISVIISTLIGGGLLFLVIRFCPVYMCVAFGVGALAALLFILPRMKPENKDMFDAFSSTYARFIPDDELRTLLYNKDYKKIRSRLRIMGVLGTFVPDFDALEKKKK